MVSVSKEIVAKAVREHLPAVAINMPEDICAALANAARADQGSEGAQSKELDSAGSPGSLALSILQNNADLAEETGAPICQDTGSVWCALEIGPEVSVAGDVLSAVDEAVASVYTSYPLRKSMVRDGFWDRANTQNNTPAFKELLLSERPGARLHLMVKGGGSDNASRLVMLNPGDGRDGIVEAVLAQVREKGANACPPLILGVGIGGTFDKVAGLAKRALMRPVGMPSETPQVATLEADLLRLVNELAMGPAALGGAPTALAVAVETAPCHIASMPLAIALGCCATRRATIELF